MISAVPIVIRRRPGLCLLGLMLMGLLASPGLAQFSLPIIDITPTEVLSDQTFSFTIQGEWFDSCVPADHVIQILDPAQKYIQIVGTLTGTFCDDVGAPFLFSDTAGPVGPLAAGTWTVDYYTQGTEVPQNWETISLVVRDPVRVRFSSASYAGVEGETVAVTVEIEGGNPLGITVAYATADGTATQNSDYTASAGSLFWIEGDTTPQSFDVPLLRDTRSEGSETVLLSLLDPSGADLGIPAQATLTVFDPYVPPAAAFDFSPALPEVGETVRFSDASAGEIVSWFWSFGDGATSTSPSPSHVYGAPGRYEVSLTVGDGELSSSTSRTIEVVEPPPVPPTAAFAWTPLQPVVGQTVEFEDRSTGEIASWLWSFGDGGSATTSDPSHVFDEVGDYRVTLEVSGPGGTSTASADLTVEPLPLVELAASVVTGSEGIDAIRVPVRRDGTSGEVSAVVTAVGGSATAGGDHTFVRQAVSWEAGESGIRFVRIPLIDDGRREPPETIELELTEVEGAAAGRRRATAVIEDDDFGVGEEELISDDDAPRLPDVASFSPIGFDDLRRRQVVVWEAGDGDRGGIFAKILDADGVVVVPTFRVNERIEGDQRDPRVVLDGEGRLVIVWREVDGAATAGTLTQRAGGSSLFGQFFGLDGEEESEEIELGGEESPSEPSVATDGSGSVVVTWEENEQVVSQQIGQGGDPQPPTVLGQGSSPQVARTSIGNYVVLWSVEEDDGAGALRPRSGGSSLFGTFYGTDGSPVAGPTAVEEQASNAAADGGGGDQYVVAFVRTGADGDDDIQAKVVGVNGTDRVKRFQVNASERGDERSPAVAVNSAGDFVVVWETDFGIYARFFDRRARPVGGDVWVAGSTPSLAAVSPEVSLDDGDLARVVWEHRAADGTSRGVSSRLISPTVSAGCQAGDQTLCLQDGRFEVRVEWRTPQGASGTARAEALSGDTGYFWFFRDTNVELLIKVLDGCPVNGRYWVFAGGLTDVETAVVVTDSVTGESRRYRNGQGTAFQPIQDTAAFAGCAIGSGSTATLTTDASTVARALSWQSRAASGRTTAVVTERVGDCVPSEERLCLGDGRFAVEAEWRTPQGNSGSARARPLTGDTGWFWFFAESNVEMVVKVLDGCALNQRFWVFAGGLTNVEVRWRVTDTATGEVVEYVNPLDAPFAPVQDTDALGSCP